jgi:hypothetical protein
MQRNMDLVRTILMRMEGNPTRWPSQDMGIKGLCAQATSTTTTTTTPAPLQALGIQGSSVQEVGYHVHIMLQEGLIEGFDASTPHSAVPEAIPTSLTWKGHEFLDLARDQERWNRARAIIAKVGSAPILVWTKVLNDLLLKSVETVAAKPR